MYLTVDGGGSKLVAACFDKDFNVISRGRSGGVNTTQNTRESVVAHVRECLDQTLAGITSIDEVFVVFVGSQAIFETELRARASVGEIHFLGESNAGLVAGAGKNIGLLALSGTGSDVFYIGQNSRVSVGGWGPVLGDQGSGTWIGLQAIRAAVRQLNGWGQETALTPMILEHFNAQERPWSIVNQVYGAPAPYPVVARLTPLVARAARQGDPVALDIFRQAGEAMATQMKVVFQRAEGLSDKEITLCGGAWKAHPAMLESFRAEMQAFDPEITVHRPWFEHMVAGPMTIALRQGMDRMEARRILAEKFTQEIISQEV